MVTMRDKWISIGKTFLKFVGVGFFGTVAHYSLLIILVSFYEVGAVWSSSAGFILGAFVNYLLNYHYTFQSNERHLASVTKFYVIATIGFFLNGVIMSFTVVSLQWHYLIAQVFSTVIILGWTFSGNLLWTFRGKTSKCNTSRGDGTSR
jgi:putative flippase GtrA